MNALMLKRQYGLTLMHEEFDTHATAWDKLLHRYRAGWEKSIEMLRKFPFIVRL
jgi:hypothetical protein